MPAIPFKNPFKRFEILNTDSVDAQRDFAMQCGASDIRVADDTAFSAHASRVTLKDIELIYGDCSTSMSIAHPGAQFHRMMLQLTAPARAKVGRAEFDLGRGQSPILHADRPITMQAEGASSWVTLRVRPEALLRRYISLNGEVPRDIFEFDRVADRSEPASIRLHALVALLAKELNEIDPPNATIVAGLEDLLLTAFLELDRSRPPEEQIGPASHRQARIVAEYLQANRDHNVTHEELAAVSGISTRSLSRAFTRIYGRSPMVYAKEQRLARAHQLLAAAGGAISVASVARSCGFSNLGHFARDYAAMFGELPSETRARSGRRHS